MPFRLLMSITSTNTTSCRVYTKISGRGHVFTRRTSAVEAHGGGGGDGGTVIVSQAEDRVDRERLGIIGAGTSAERAVIVDGRHG